MRVMRIRKFPVSLSVYLRIISAKAIDKIVSKTYRKNALFIKIAIYQDNTVILQNM